MLPNHRKPYSRTQKAPARSAAPSSGMASPGTRRKKKIPWYKKLLRMMVPTKKDSTIDKARKIIFDLAILVFIGSCTYLVNYYGESDRNAKFYDGVAGMLGKGEVSENYPRAYLTKFASLWEMNEDIVGWLSIDGTKVNYPVVQSDDNDYYLHKDFSKADNKHGIPFADCRVDISIPSTNIPIYSHNMKDGQMFGELINYQDLNYYKQHPVINFDSLYEEGKYKIVAMFIASTLPEHAPNFEYHNFIQANSDEELMNFANEVLSRSLIVTGVDIQPGDQLITLSTCTYDFKEARFAMVARRVREGESETVDTSTAHINPNPVMPKAWYEAKKIAALVAGVSLSPENLNLKPGETVSLTATVLPNTAVNRNVRWDSSDSSVASVDQSGTVTAHRSGTAVITVTTEESSFTASATVTVGAGPITSMYFASEGVSVKVGEGVDLTSFLVVEPEGANLDELQWSSSDPSVASVSGGGVTGKKMGTATITVTASSGASASITVQVGSYVPIERIGIVGSSTVTVGGSTSLSLVIQPDIATNQNATWSIERGDRNISLSGSGTSATVTGKKQGTAKVTATINDNGQVKEASIIITVTDKAVAPDKGEFVSPDGSDLPEEGYHISVNDGANLSDYLRVDPVGADKSQLIWSSSDENVATIDSSGNLKSLTDGIVTITVRKPDGSFFAKVNVTVGTGNAVKPPKPENTNPENPNPDNPNPPEDNPNSPGGEDPASSEALNPPEEPPDPDTPDPGDNPGGEGEGEGGEEEEKPPANIWG